jgi:hypothetical protein
MLKRQLGYIVGFVLLLCMACAAVQAAIDYESVTIKEIQDGNTTFMGKAVAIEGEIVKECPSRGCWFVLDDETGSLLVDIKPNNFTIPLELVGSKAKVYGNVTAVGEKKKLTFDPGTPYVIGKKVELTGEFNSPLIATG